MPINSEVKLGRPAKNPERKEKEKEITALKSVSNNIVKRERRSNSFLKEISPVPTPVIRRRRSRKLVNARKSPEIPAKVTAKCKYCNQSDEKWPLKKCVVCKSKAHVQCLKQERKGIVILEGKLRCPDCISCVICEKKKSSPTNVLATCSKCAISFHAECHLPKIPAETKSWTCRKCSVVANDTTETKPVKAVTSPSSPIFDDFFQKSEIDNFDPKTIKSILDVKPPTPVSVKLDHIEPDPKVPDASKWSSDEVYEYFVTHFPTEAQKFREQEIDGVSLLLMKRSDVITGLNFKLGPALRIYKHIVMLQTKNTDPRLTWY